MQTSLDKPPQKVKNILIRSSHKQKRNSDVHHPETTHILKYSPKYYHSLTLEIRPFSPLLSKIKKIKKLKKFKGHTGIAFKEIFPQALWFNLLANSRKEIEAPEIPPHLHRAKLKKSFWRRLNLQNIRNFPNATKVSQFPWRFSNPGYYADPDPFRTIPDHFALYIGHLRRLKILEIAVNGENYHQAKYIVKGLDGMKGLFGRLERLMISIEDQEIDAGSIFENRNLFSHVTDLSLFAPFDPSFANIPQICKKLEYLSIGFLNYVSEEEFRHLLISMQNLKQLKSLVFHLPEDARNFWGYFKPQSSLRHLSLNFKVSQLINEGLFRENIELSPKDAVVHWKEIEELEVLAFDIDCYKAQEVIFARQFITMVLKKVRKVRSLRYRMRSIPDRNEPFFIEEVPHLYESLERFDHYLSNSTRNKGPLRFDVKMLKPFRNLKTLKFDGGDVIYENLEEAVSLLEENQKKGGAAGLEIKSYSMPDENCLGETLMKIEKVKREDKNLEMHFEFSFKTGDVVKSLERFCEDLKALKIIKGLAVTLMLVDCQDASPLPVENLREILSNNSNEIRNFKLWVCNRIGALRYFKLEGEKEELKIY